jgi:hypothetical protein
MSDELWVANGIIADYMSWENKKILDAVEIALDNPTHLTAEYWEYWDRKKIERLATHLLGEKMSRVSQLERVSEL